MFQEGLGLPFERMNKFVRAESLKGKWAFNVIQMNSSFTVKADALKAKLGGQKGPKGTIKGFEVSGRTNFINADEIARGLSAPVRESIAR